MSVLGAVRSILMPPTVSEEALSARSETEAVVDRALPSPPIVESAGQAPIEMPDRPSAQVHATVTSSLYQPLPFGSVDGAPLMAGAVRSTRKCASVPVPVLPATSRTET